MYEQRKLAKSHEANKRTRVGTRVDTSQEKKEEECKIKDIQIEKVRNEIRENNEQKSHLLNMKTALRKKDQEDNLKRIQLQKSREKVKLIEKIRESDSLNKSKLDIDISRIYAQAEREFKRKHVKK